MAESYTRQEDQATAIACLSLFTSLGSEIGLSGCAVTLQRVLRLELWKNMVGKRPDMDDLIDEITGGLANVRHFPHNLQSAVRASYEVAIGWTFVLCLAFSVLGLFASFFVQERSLGTRK